MPTTYLTDRLPDLLTLGAKYGAGSFSSGFDTGYETGAGVGIVGATGNGRPAVADPIRALEEAIRYIACSEQPGCGGSMRGRDVTGEIMYLRLAKSIYPYLMEIRLLHSASAAGAYVSVLSEYETTTIAPQPITVAAAITDPSDALESVITIPVAAIGAAAPGDVDVSVAWVAASGTIVLWSWEAVPVQLGPTQELAV